MQKKQKSSEVLMEGRKKLVKVNGWSIEHLEAVYSKIKELNYINEWVWKKPVKSPDKKFIAEVFCQHEVKNINISIVIRDKKGIEISREKIYKELPDEFAKARHLGELKWLSNYQVS